jgi:hypothetical protein
VEGEEEVEGVAEAEVSEAEEEVEEGEEAVDLIVEVEVAEEGVGEGLDEVEGDGTDSLNWSLHCMLTADELYHPYWVLKCGLPLPVQISTVPAMAGTHASCEKVYEHYHCAPADCTQNVKEGVHYCVHVQHLLFVIIRNCYVSTVSWDKIL